MAPRARSAISFGTTTRGSRVSRAESTFSRLVFVMSTQTAFSLRDYAKELSFDQARLEEIEDRLELLGGLKRKYGGSIESVLREKGKIEKELKGISSLEEEVSQVCRATEQVVGEVPGAQMDYGCVHNTCSRDADGSIHGYLTKAFLTSRWLAARRRAAVGQNADA